MRAAIIIFAILALVAPVASIAASGPTKEETKSWIVHTLKYDEKVYASGKDTDRGYEVDRNSIMYHSLSLAFDGDIIFIRESIHNDVGRPLRLLVPEYEPDGDFFEYTLYARAKLSQLQYNVEIEPEGPVYRLTLICHTNKCFIVQRDDKLIDEPKEISKRGITRSISFHVHESIAIRSKKAFEHLIRLSGGKPPYNEKLF